MGTGDVFQALKIARAACECNLRTWKISRVTIYHEIHEQWYEYDFSIYNIPNNSYKKFKKYDRHASMDTQLCNGF